MIERAELPVQRNSTLSFWVMGSKSSSGRHRVHSNAPLERSVASTYHRPLLRPWLETPPRRCRQDHRSRLFPIARSSRSSCPLPASGRRPPSGARKLLPTRLRPPPECPDG